MRDQAIAKIHDTRGLSVRVANACGIHRAAVYQWERVPVGQVNTVAGIIDMPPQQIRPDIFRDQRSSGGEIADAGTIDEMLIAESARSIAWALIEMKDQKKLGRVAKYINDHLNHPDRSPMERLAAVGLAGYPGLNGDLGKQKPPVKRKVTRR